GVRDAESQDDGQHRRLRHERLHLAVVGRGEIPRVERQQQDGKDARHEPAQPVDDGVLAEPPKLRRDRHYAKRESTSSRPSAICSTLCTRSTYAREARPIRRRSPWSATSAARRSRSVSAVADTIGTSTPNASSVLRTASSCRNVTTGLPS